MKSTIYSVTGEKTAEIELPFQFSEPIREDLIKRAALSVLSYQFQPKGTDPIAGTRQGKQTQKRRHRYGTTYGRGVSRIKRKVMSKRGSQFGWVGAFASPTRKGRAAFPPEVGKQYWEKINTKERRKAIRSAIAATTVKELIAAKHILDGVKSIPIIVEDKFESFKKAKEVVATFEKLGLTKELERISERKIRAGQGKRRGRKYVTKTGPLVIVSKECSLQNAADNLLGVEVVPVKSLNAYLLAPGAQAGRLTIWTKSAIETLGKEKLFM